LKPPDPPPESNLRLTDWFGAPVPFNGTARYVCKRGMQFELDPLQEFVEYTCQVGFSAIDATISFTKYRSNYINDIPLFLKYSFILNFKNLRLKEIRNSQDIKLIVKS
jgi:hypothetical protein